MRGVAVTDLDGLTGLAEYRNGGLFVDAGVIALRDPDAGTRGHEPGSELVVEWRALTVALLDRIAPLVRDRLGVDAARFPLGAVLEGGTWAAGRRLANAEAAGRRRRRFMLSATARFSDKHWELTTCAASPSSITRWCSTS